MEPIISTQSLNRVFRSGQDTVHALRDVSISAKQGALTVLKGRSGSGKTTLINILSALDRPTSGQVYMAGRNLTSLSDAQQDLIRRTEVGYIFQSVALIPLMSAYENVEFALRLSGRFPRRQWNDRVVQCLGMVGLKNRMRHRPAELSGGEQQRVAIARALVHKPTVIFADEPTAELDTYNGLQMMKLFRDLIAQEGVSIVMTTHDPNMMELADHLYTLEDGAIAQDITNAQPGGDAQ